MRCYALSEYWYGNREKGIQQLQKARDLHMFDAEILYNLTELYLLEHRYRKASELISFFKKHKEDLECYDKKSSFYESKMRLFEAYIATYDLKKQTASRTTTQ